MACTLQHPVYSRSSQVAAQKNENSQTRHGRAPSTHPRTHPAPGMGVELKTPRFWRVAWFLELTRACGRVRVRAAYKLCVCVQYGNRESGISKSPPPAFPCYSDSEMTARPNPADFEDEFKAPPSDVPLTLHKTSSKRQRLSRGPSAPPVVEVGLVWPFSAVPGPI